MHISLIAGNLFYDMNGLNKLLRKLIKTGAGRKKFLAAIAGLSIAMLLILAAVQIQADYHELLNSKSNKDSIANFLVINKTLTDQNLGATGLSTGELDDLKKQSFVEEIGWLTPSRFKASIQSASDRFPFYTDIAFEAVPDAFIDVNDKDWGWDENKGYIPIIVPNMFLDFYNFQFSFSQNLPQLTHEVVRMIGFRINIYGKNGMVTYNGRVVGFSDRISSLLVPQHFMEWANKQFSDGGEKQPSRVILRTKDPGNPQLVEYLKTRNLSTDNDKTRFSRYRQVVDLVVKISWITGAIMLVFAILIFTLFIQLTIASCREEVILLITLGASPQQLQRFLARLFLPVIFGITLLSLSVTMLLQLLLRGFLEKQHVFISSLIAVSTVGVAVSMVLLISLFIRYSIKQNITLTNKK
jgi:hypothetical protein